eukprot:CAMPEP_0172689822 /NCGR_PEP_ID=MMETSP1074-20121228/23420_1 /TAXON_ID=2916 /ORGANISM="Ceratium fusus, Strain PA161109" /LENGTH=33 /DNA_ID= /DNA_START= /DNA_END= /DNA_ORIENTATION=
MTCCRWMHGQWPSTLKPGHGPHSECSSLLWHPS